MKVKTNNKKDLELNRFLMKCRSFKCSLKAALNFARHYSIFDNVNIFIENLWKIINLFLILFS